jgi:hypothetical protein
VLQTTIFNIHGKGETSLLRKRVTRHREINQLILQQQILKVRLSSIPFAKNWIKQIKQLSHSSDSELFSITASLHRKQLPSYFSGHVKLHSHQERLMEH